VFTAFLTINFVVMWTWPQQEMLPFHFIFLGLTLVYGYALWNRNMALGLSLLVTVVAGAVLVWHARQGMMPWEEGADAVIMLAIFVGTMWHVGRRQRKQEEVEGIARKQQDLLDREQQFMQDASHALRTPLTVARGHLDLARALVDDPQVLDDLDVVVAQLDRLKHLAATLVALNRVSGRQELYRERVDLADLVSEVYQRWAPLSQRQWGFAAPRGGALAEVDPQLFEMALEAALENAVNHTTENQRVRLSVVSRDNLVTVRIDDSGPGVPPDERELVFERFSRGRTARPYSGSGLGLALVRAVAISYGGNAVIAESPLGGAALIMTLPAFDMSPADEMAAPTQAPSPELRLA